MIMTGIPRGTHSVARYTFDSCHLTTSRYLIEPGEGSVRPEHDADTQTDEFEDRPQTPDFVPKKTGVDVCTQIETSDKLFDLDREIQPLLDVLVGKVRIVGGDELCGNHLLFFHAPSILATAAHCTALGSAR